ncbi:MAG: hypothetical protein K2K57_02745, partial [Oscillospiraceae bacterium]|nr:hypothetical protein [Oscillospiraceae bacterium]
AVHNIFISTGFGTMIFVTMLIMDNGLNETLKSVLIWVAASCLYGLTFEIMRVRSRIKFPLHIALCFLITVAARATYSYITKGYVDLTDTAVITIPIFAAVYIALYFFMKFTGSIEAYR